MLWTRAIPGPFPGATDSWPYRRQLGAGIASTLTLALGQETCHEREVGCRSGCSSKSFLENGANWLPSFLEKMDKMRGMAKNGYWPCGQLKERPSRIFRRHCYVVAYPEDDIQGIVERIGGSECLLMGSDYPHAEGVPTPLDFYKEALTQLPAGDIRAIMYDNGRRLPPKAA